MKIKHSKYKNTGLIFELLVKQIAADTLNNKDSAAVSIIKKHFTGKSALVREFKLYEFILKNKGIGQAKAETILSTITEISRKIDQKTLKTQKYDLISSIKENYNLDEFFAIQTQDYKALASLYCLLEAQNNNDIVDPKYLINFKSTLLEHLTTQKQNAEDVKDTLIEEYSKYDKDLKLLTFKILLEKFNDTYKDLLPEQKNILKEFITSVNSTTRLRNLVNEELTKISNIVKKLSSKVKDEVVKIKLDEVAKAIVPVSSKDKVSDTHLVNLMQYYDLVNELKSL
jgi:ribosomal protein S13